MAIDQYTNNCIKAISETDDELRVANYIILYGGRDLEGIASPEKNVDGSIGQYFTPDTELESPYTKTGRLYVDWEHGFDKDPAAPKKDDIMGYVDWTTTKSDEIGLWVERVLYRRNLYMKYLETLIKEGLIGNSTEAIRSKVAVAADGKINKWPLKRDTLTVNPMEPRMMTQNVIGAIKALAAEYPGLKALLPQETGTVSEQATSGSQSPSIEFPYRRNTMTDVTLSMQEYKDLLKSQVAPQAAPAPEVAEDPAIKAINERLAYLTDIIAKSPILKQAGYVAPESTDDEDADVKSFGDYLVAVKNGNRERLARVYGSTWDGEKATKNRKTALAEDAGATGGYLVPTQFVAPIMAIAKDFSVLRRAGATIVPMNAKGAEVPALDVETAPSAGDTAYAAGVVAYWEDEAAALTESEPRFRLIELVNHKLAGYSLASNEVRADSAASIEALLTTMFGRAVGSKENYAFFRGDGVKKPWGILNSSAAKLDVTRSAASAVALADLGGLFGSFLSAEQGRGAFFCNPTVLGKIVQIASAPVSFLDNARGMPALTLLGLPVYTTGALPALNTAGDIILADPSYYLIGDRQALTIAYSEHVKFLTDQGTWRFTHRVDGQPWINAGVTLENAATVLYPFVGLAAG